MRTRDFCVAVKRLARLLSTIRQYNVRDTPGAVFAGTTRGREGREGDWRGAGWRRRRGGFRADTEISPILEGWLATPQFARLSSCFHPVLDSTLLRPAIFTLVYRDDALPSPSLSLFLFLSSQGRARDISPQWKPVGDHQLICTMEADSVSADLMNPIGVRTHPFVRYFLRL